MNKSRKDLFVLLAAALFFWTACNKEEVPSESISVSKSELNFEASGNLPVSLDVKTDGKWTAGKDSSWVVVAPASGSGNCTVIISVRENVVPGATTLPRTAMVTFVSGKAEAKVFISQKGQEGDPTPPTPPTPPATEDEVTFTFASAILDDAVSVGAFSEGVLKVVTAEEVKGSTSFTLTVPLVDNYVIVSPASALSDGVISIPSVQDGKGLQIKAAVVSKNNLGSITLNTISSTVSASFSGENLASALVIPMGEESITGGFSITDNAGTPSISALSGGSHAITLTNPASDFSVAVMPAVYASGIAVRPYTQSGITTGAFADGEVVANAGEVVTAVVNREIQVDNEDDLYRLVSIPLGSNSVVDTALAINNAFRVYGSTIKLSSKTYNPSRTLKMKYLFEGFDYKVHFTLQGVDGTVITGNGERRICELDENTDITFKGIAFNDGSPSNGDGGAFLCYGGKASIENCSFHGNMVRGLNGSGELGCSGAVLSASASSDGTPSDIAFKGCSVVSDGQNTLLARNGGAFFTSKDSKISCTDCSFKGLYTFNTGGVANNSGGTQEYDGCTIEDCGTIGGAGAAFHANADGAILIVRDCTFKNCKGHINEPYETTDNKACGVISIQKASLTMYGCTFDSCEASAASLIQIQSAESFNKISNCIFKNNRNASRGLVQVNGNSVTFMDNCLFDGNVTRTGSWGRVVHGANPSVLCMNGITVANHTTLDTSETGSAVMLNTDGSLLLSNSTVVGKCNMAMLRNTNAGTRNLFTVLNSIVLNEQASAPVIGKVYDAKNSSWSSLMRASLTTAYNRFSACDIAPSGDMSTYGSPLFSPGTGDIADRTVTGMGLAFDSVAGCFLWNGPEAAEVKADSEAMSALMKSFNPTVSNSLIGSAPIGEQFLEWLKENGSFDKSSNGVSRGSAWWPGAYQKQ